MVAVAHLNDRAHDARAVRVVKREADDARIRLRDRRGHGGEPRVRVVDEDFQGHRKARFRLRNVAPLDVHPAGGIGLGAALGVRAVGAVHGKALPRTAEAADVVARNRVAAGSEMKARAFAPLDDDGGEVLGLRPVFALFGEHLVADREDAVQNRGGETLPEPDRGVEGRKALGPELLENELSHVVGQSREVDPFAFGQVFKSQPPEPHRFVELAVPQILTDFGARAPRMDVLQPRGRGRGVGARDDFDLVAVTEFAREGLGFAVHAGRLGVVADIGVDFVRKVDRARSARQRDDLPLRGKDIDAVREEVDLDVFEEFRAVGARTLDFEEILEPGGRAGLKAACVLVAVEPVNENAVLVDAVHLFGTDLVFDRRSVRTDHGRVKALVAVHLRNRDEIFEARVYGFVEAMEAPERKVAVVERAHDHAEAVNVERVGKGLVLFAHLVVDAVNRLVAPEDAHADSVAGELLAGLIHDALKDGTSLVSELQHVLVENLVAEGVAVCKGELLQLAKDVVEPQAVRERHVDVERLAGDAGALFGAHHAEGAHVVQTVGKLHENDAHVARHRKEHLAKAFGLGDFVRRKAQLVELRDAVDDVRHLGAEEVRHLDFACLRVFENVVHEAGRNRLRVHAPGGENARDGKGMRDVGLARLAELPEVRVVGVAVGASNVLDVRGREVHLDRVEELRRGHDRRGRLGGEKRQVGVGQMTRVGRRVRAGPFGLVVFLSEPEGRNGARGLREGLRLGVGSLVARGVEVLGQRGNVDGHDGNPSGSVGFFVAETPIDSNASREFAAPDPKAGMPKNGESENKFGRAPRVLGAPPGTSGRRSSGGFSACINITARAGAFRDPLRPSRFHEARSRWACPWRRPSGRSPG